MAWIASHVALDEDSTPEKLRDIKLEWARARDNMLASASFNFLSKHAVWVV